MSCTTVHYTLVFCIPVYPCVPPKGCQTKKYLFIFFCISSLVQQVKISLQTLQTYKLCLSFCVQKKFRGHVFLATLYVVGPYGGSGCSYLNRIPRWQPPSASNGLNTISPSVPYRQLHRYRTALQMFKLSLTKLILFYGAVTFLWLEQGYFGFCNLLKHVKAIVRIFGVTTHLCKHAHQNRNNFNFIICGNT